MKYISKKILWVLLIIFLLGSYIFINSFSDQSEGSFIYPDFINPDHELPVITITTNPDNLWDSETGIYAEENYLKKGKEWQRPATIQFFEPSGELGFTRDIGLRIHGGGTRTFPQKSFRIYASNTDDDDYFEYPIFGENEKTHSFTLRNAGGDWEAAFMRDVLTHRLVSERSNLEIQRDRPVAVYLNGEYWGLYYARERQDEYYLSEKYNLDISKISILDTPHGTGEERGHTVVDYGKDAQDDSDLFNSLLDEARKCDDCAEYHYFRQFLDIKNMIDYNLFEIHFANFDWPYGNSKTWRYQTFVNEDDAPIGHNGKFRWLLFDLDVGMGHGSQNEEDMIKAAVNGDYGRFIDNAFPFRNIFNDETFLREYLNRYADMLNTTLKPANVISQIDNLESEIESEMPRQIERWKDYSSPADNKVSQSMQEWRYNVELLRVYARHREEMMRKNTINQFDLDEDVVIFLDTNDYNGGGITMNTISIPGNDLPWSGTYFAKQSIKITADPSPGYKFVKWEGDIADEISHNISIDKITDSDIKLKAVFEKTLLNKILNNLKGNN